MPECDTFRADGPAAAAAAAAAVAALLVFFLLALPLSLPALFFAVRFQPPLRASPGPTRARFTAGGAIGAEGAITKRRRRRQKSMKCGLWATCRQTSLCASKVSDA